MDKKDLLALLDNVVEENDTESLNRHSRVLVIDALNLFFRNFAMLGFVNETGAHVGGLGGFLRSLGTLIGRMDPTSVYIVFDGVGSTINRKNLIPEYKADRHLTRITNWDAFDNIEDEHDAKVNQLVRLIHYLKCLPVKTISIDKVEADDVIAHLSTTLAEKYDSKVFIVSSDRDFIQLVNNNITVYRPIEKDYYTPSTVQEKFGVLAENFIYYKTLLGDNSDKVKGLKGLGEKKLHKLFPELGQRPITLQDLYDISEVKLKENVIYARLLHDFEELEKSYKVMNLHKPMIDDNDREFIGEVIEELAPDLNTVVFIKFYNEDGLRHLIKNVEFWTQSTFKDLISYNK
jgi:5'-3' exonuclease